MKKILAVIMSALLILTAFAACSRSGEGNNTAQGMTESAANAKYKVYLITIDKMDQHWVSVDKGASDMAKQLGITYKWDAPDVKDNAKQIEAVNNAIADGASLIMLAANDPSAISQTVKNAKDKGVKIIYVDSPANEPAVTTLSTDNYNAGMIAGETMLEELKNAGITSGKIGIIGVNTATNSSMNREKGFREAITKDGKFTLLILAGGGNRLYNRQLRPCRTLRHQRGFDRRRGQRYQRFRQEDNRHRLRYFEHYRVADKRRKS